MAAKKLKKKNGIFAAVGAATGLGNAFRFPALCISYGAAFILAYAVVLAAVCYPLLCAELKFGRRKPEGKGAKIWVALMIAATANSAFIALYYGVIAAKLGSESLSFIFFPRSDGGNIFTFVWAAFFVLVAAYALLKGSSRALGASGKLSVCLSLLLFTALAAAGLTRGGAFSSFDFNELSRFSIWKDALGQALLALSLAAGVMPSYAKSLPEPFSARATAFKIVAANFAVCILASLSVLPFSVTFSRTVGITCALNAYKQVIFTLFSGGAGARFSGAALFFVLTVVAVHSLCSLAFPLVSRAAARFNRAPLCFCLLAACLAPLFACKNMSILNACDALACSVNAVAIAAAEAVFFVSRAHITGVKLTFEHKSSKIMRGNNKNSVRYEKDS